MRLFWKSERRKRPKPSPSRARLSLEQLEARVVLYSATSNLWPHPELITVSFVPDGTVISSGTQGNVTSNLFAKFNSKFGSQAVWQNALVTAAQDWAQAANINFSVVADNGAQAGSGAYQQGDPGMGDIRFSSIAMGSNYLGLGYFPPPGNNYSGAGDISFNSTANYNVSGANYDLASVAMHEVGHALGMDHSSYSTAVQYGAYHGRLAGLTADDVAGIRAIYGARTGDAYGGSGVATPNNSFQNAADISSQIDPLLGVGQLTNLDISTTSQAEYFKFTAPLVSLNTLTVSAQSAGLSLLRPNLTLYAADQTTVLGSTSGAGSYRGSTLTLNYSGGLLGLSLAGQTFYVKVTGADATAFGTGTYDLSLSMGLGALPAVTAPVTTTLNGDVFSGGAGAAEVTNFNVDPNTVDTNLADFYVINDTHAVPVSHSDSAPGSVQPGGNFSGAAQVIAAQSAMQNATAQGLAQIALAIAPAGISPFENVHLPTLTPAGLQPSGVMPFLPQASPVGPRQDALMSLFTAEARKVSAEVASPESLRNENESSAPQAAPSETPSVPSADVAQRQQTADMVFTDYSSLADLGLPFGEGTLGQEGAVGAGVLLNESVADDKAAPGSEADSRGTSPALAGVALLGGVLWTGVSSGEDPRSRLKQLKGQASY